MTAIRVLMVDDHRMFVECLRGMIEQESDIEVVGVCYDGPSAVARCAEMQPDVVLMDFNMPAMTGAEATRRMLERRLETAVIILTMERQDAQMFQAIKDGARGYILKDAQVDDVVRAVRRVARGETIIDPLLTTRILSEFKRVWHSAAPGAAEGLKERELVILRLLAHGYTNREIAAELCFSEKTVKNYLTMIFHKLQITDRTQAAVYAVQHGLVDPGSPETARMMAAESDMAG